MPGIGEEVPHPPTPQTNIRRGMTRGMATEILRGGASTSCHLRKPAIPFEAGHTPKADPPKVKPTAGP
jgi:hypothetical protein